MVVEGGTLLLRIEKTDASDFEGREEKRRRGKLRDREERTSMVAVAVGRRRCVEDDSNSNVEDDINGGTPALL